MRDYRKFFIDGQWVDPAVAADLEVINPATEQTAGYISLGSEADVDLAVASARRAFGSFGRTSVAERHELLQSILAEFMRRKDDVSAAISEEMGAPKRLSDEAQSSIGAGHLQVAIEALSRFKFEERRGTTLIRKEPIGVCAFITPWNWPINQIACKVVPALATGCTMILKPSEIAPFSAHVWAEILDAAGLPVGVFNLINGDGPTVGRALSKHVGIDLISFTGSTRAGIEVARDAADTVKRVHQELGGKSPNIILPDASIDEAVAAGVAALMVNSGQSCNAPTRMLVPKDRMDDASKAARAAVAAVTVGIPGEDVSMGPVASKAQWEKIQRLIRIGVDEGADLVAGGPDRPEGLEMGYFVKPTVFANVVPEMEIAREEIFGPVLVIMGYEDVADAVRIANDTPYGLAAYVQGIDETQMQAVMQDLRAGQVFFNYAPIDLSAPFGGYKQSGNGREWGELAFHEFLETKAVMGVKEAVT
ncbi:aldehyde dehydrogenase family protein [soil metagenome]